MAGQAASGIVLFGSVQEPQQRSSCLIQINAPATRALNDHALPEQPASPTAPEDMQS